MMVDGEIYEDLTPERADEILADTGRGQMLTPLTPLTAEIRPDRAALDISAPTRRPAATRASARRSP